MKKLGLLVMPLMAVSLLASCNNGGGDIPDPTVVHTLKYLYDNGTDKSFTEKYIDDEKTKEPTWTPTYAGHTFVGWYVEEGEGEEGTEFTFGGALTGNETTIHAHWDTNPPEPGITHNIYLDPCGGTFGQDQKEVIKGVVHNTVVEKAPVVTREGYEDPTWWYETDDGKAEFKFGTNGTLVTKDYFLHAYWGEEHPSKYSVSFIGDDCTGKTGTMITGVSEFQTDILYDDFDNVTITINPKTDFHLLTTEITVLKDGVKTTSQDDYTYVVSDSVGTVTLKSKGDFLVKIKATPDTPTQICSVTFDAGANGKFPNGEQKISFKLDSGTKLLPYIKALTPTLEGQTFAYYEYEGKDNAIDYDDTVTSDVTLEANYLPSSTAPTDDLTEFNWETIKKIAVTGDPSRWFNIGATKKVYLKGQTSPHTVRIIDFNHDYSELPDDGSDPDPSKVLGITFEFANVITDSSDNAVTKHWNDKQSTGSTNYDYRKSTLNDFLNIDVLSMLPSRDDPDNPDLREVIKPVDKKVGVSTDGGQNYPATSFDGSDDYPYPYLFALAHDEMADNATGVTKGEGSKYQYYIEHPNETDRIKRKARIEGENGEYYWLRSPYTGLSSSAWSVGTDGGLDNGHVYYHAYAVAPAFCI